MKFTLIRSMFGASIMLMLLQVSAFAQVLLSDAELLAIKIPNALVCASNENQNKWAELATGPDGQHYGWETAEYRHPDIRGINPAKAEVAHYCEHGGHSKTGWHDYEMLKILEDVQDTSEDNLDIIDFPGISCDVKVGQECSASKLLKAGLGRQVCDITYDRKVKRTADVRVKPHDFVKNGKKFSSKFQSYRVEVEATGSLKITDIGPSKASISNIIMHTLPLDASDEVRKKHDCRIPTPPKTTTPRKAPINSASRVYGKIIDKCKSGERFCNGVYRVWAVNTSPNWSRMTYVVTAYNPDSGKRVTIEVTTTDIAPNSTKINDVISYGKSTWRVDSKHTPN